MSFQSTFSSVPGILAVLDAIDVPSFVLTVDDAGKIRFGGLNRAHEARTGMKGADIAGLTPHEALPPRTADTVLANYRHCAESCQTYQYEEVLDLPCGRKWWLTSLSPLIEQGRTTMIIGVATDITEMRTEIIETSADLGDLRVRAENLQTLGRAVMTETRGPLNNVIALGRLMRADFQPLTAEKDEVLDLMLETAQGALAQIDAFELESKSAPAPCMRSASKVNLDHTCRDLAALIDPDRKLSITFPDSWILTDGPALNTTLHTLLETVAGRARSFIHISVAPEPRRPRTVRLLITFDPDGAEPDEDPAWLRAAVEARGGSLRRDREGGAASEDREVIELAFPGKLLPTVGTGNAARSVNQRLPGRASG